MGVSQLLLSISLPSSAFGRRIKSKTTWGDAAPIFPGKIDEDAYNRIVDDMLAVLSTYGLTESIEVEGGLKGYRVPATVIEWRLGSPEEQQGTNPFFHDLYHNIAEMLQNDTRLLHRLQAREHTAQVDALVGQVTLFECSHDGARDHHDQ
jgi:hypothetical protein